MLSIPVHKHASLRESAKDGQHGLPRRVHKQREIGTSELDHPTMWETRTLVKGVLIRGALARPYV